LAAIAFGVSNLDDRIAEAEALGLKMVSRIGYKGVEDQAQFHPKDTFGVQIELNERLEGFSSVSERPVDAFQQGIDHVHVYVQDIERAIDLFIALTGYEFHAPISVDEARLKAASNALGLDLLQPTSSDSPIAKTIAIRGEGAHSIAFKATSVEEGIKKAQSAGLTLLSQIVYEGMFKQVQFHPKDSFGIMIEFAERIR
jgi:4-hydroxyphenylpyruvate dioxygenase-like putative hemolysin